MKAAILIVGALLIHSSAWARGFQTNWNCPVGSSQKSSVEVFYDDSGKLNFEPEIFRELKPDDKIDYSSCIADFQKKISYGVKLFQEKKCSSVKDSLCSVTVQYTDAKVLEKIRHSYFMKKVKNVRIVPIGTDDTSKVVETPKVEPTVQQPKAVPVDSSPSPSTPDAFLESMIASKVINPKELNRIFTFENKNYKVSDFDQAIGNNISSIYSDMTPEEGKQFAQNYMAAKSEYLKEGSDPTKRKMVLDNLNQMFGKMYGDRGAEELSKILECDPDDNLTPIEDILNKLQKTKVVSECKPLAPGEHKVQATREYLHGDYLLKRKDNGTYQVFLNVEFKSGGGSLSPQAMMKRSKECLHEASPFMKGPNGEKLEMMAFTPAEIEKLPANERPKKKVVTIEHADFATNSGAYAEDSKCPTIAHEMLHLLGLCDEYKETRSQFGNKWDCRVTVKGESIMKNHVEAYNKAVAKDFYCECKQLPCTAIQKSGDQAAKQMFYSKDINDVSDYEFRTNYCKTRYLPQSKTLTEPSRAVVVLSNKETELLIEARAMSGAQKAPNFQVDRTEIKCVCPAGNSDCIRTKNKVAKTIQAGGNKLRCPWNVSEVDSSKANHPNVFKLKGTPELPSLLAPNHFKKILGGSCPGTADSYNECAEFAYKGPSCNVPSRCHDDKYYLGIEQ